MRWQWMVMACVAVPALGSCSQADVSIGTVGGVPSQPAFCRADLDASFIELDGAGATQTVMLSNPCGQVLVLDVYLDDPDGAFQLDRDGTIELEADDTFSVQVELTADQAGTYEAQLFVDLLDFNDGSVVEVIGTVQGDG